MFFAVRGRYSTLTCYVVAVDRKYSWHFLQLQQKSGIIW